MVTSGPSRIREALNAPGHVTLATDAVESMDRDAPRQLADGYVGDFHAVLDVDDRYRSGTPARDVKLLAVRRECHVPRTLPDRNRCGDGEAGGIDHRDRGVAAVRHEHTLAIRLHGDAVAAQA